MQHPRFLLAISTLCAVSALTRERAYADDNADIAHAAMSDIQNFAYSVWDGTTHGMFGNNFYRPVDECTAAIKRGTDAGMKATDTFEDGAGKQVLWKRAADVCTEYARLKPLATTVTELRQPIESVDAFYGTDGKPDPSITGDAFRAAAKVAQGCVDTIDKATKAGVPSDVAFAPHQNEHDDLMTLVALRKRCSDFVSWGGAAATADDNRQAEELVALRAKWGKLGITGDRLKYLVENDTHIILGKGCKELDNKGKKTSSVFYEVYSDDASWIVYKTQFKKDKQTRTSNKRFRRDGGYSCK